jgi:hypothetical protein
MPEGEATRESGPGEGMLPTTAPGIKNYPWLTFYASSEVKRAWDLSWEETREHYIRPAIAPYADIS